jgi:hypothetical protein
VSCNCFEGIKEVESEVKSYVADEEFLEEKARCGDKLILEI